MSQKPGTPPCTCKLTNPNNFAPAKGNNSLGIRRNPEGETVRPPAKNVSFFGGYMLDFFRQAPPKINLTWNSSSNRANPVKQRTPKKEVDRKGWG